MDRFHVYSPKRSISKQFKEDSRICKLGRVSHHRHYQCVKVHEDKKRASPFFQTLPPAGRRFPTDEREHHSYRLSYWICDRICI